MTTPDAAPAVVPPNLKIASTLSWIMGIVVLATGVAIGIPAALGATGGGWTFVLVACAAGLGLCYGGYGLRKGLRSAGWAAIAAAGGFVALQLVGTGGRPTLPMILYLAIIGLVATQWKSLR
jgi:lysylphosphatidylglycerol synthetase-like protein (DUF2156 family)